MTLKIIQATIDNDLNMLHDLLNPFTEKNQQLIELQKFPNINFQEQVYGNTALHYAVKIGNLMLVETLLYYGADRGIKNFRGISPMEEYENQYSDQAYFNFC